MQIFIFWPSWVGKSTLWKNLSKILKMKHIDIDDFLFWENDIDRRTEIIKDLLKQNKEDWWIFEWLYRQDWVDLILKECDLIIIFSYKKNIIKYRIIIRTIKRILWLEKSKFNSSLKKSFELLDFLDNYYKENREKEFLNRLKKLNKIDKVRFIKNNNNLDKLITEFKYSNDISG